MPVVKNIEKTAKVSAYQQETEWSCSAATLKAAALHWGVDLTEKATIKAVGARKGRGAETTDIVNGAKKLGFESWEQSFEDLDAAKAMLAKGVPIIADVQSFNYPGKGHYVLIAGFKKGKGFIIMDPNTKGKTAKENWRILSEKEMEKKWWDRAMAPPHDLMPKWGVMIMPKQKEKTAAPTHKALMAAYHKALEVRAQKDKEKKAFRRFVTNPAQSSLKFMAGGSLAGAGLGAAMGAEDDEKLRGALIGAGIGGASGLAAGLNLYKQYPKNVNKGKPFKSPGVVRWGKGKADDDLVESQVRMYKNEVYAAMADPTATRDPKVLARVKKIKEDFEDFAKKNPDADAERVKKVQNKIIHSRVTDDMYKSAEEKNHTALKTLGGAAVGTGLGLLARKLHTRRAMSNISKKYKPMADDLRKRTEDARVRIQQQKKEMAGLEDSISAQKAVNDMAHKNDVSKAFSETGHWGPAVTKKTKNASANYAAVLQAQRKAKAESASARGSWDDMGKSANGDMMDYFQKNPQKYKEYLARKEAKKSKEKTALTRGGAYAQLGLMGAGAGAALANLHGEGRRRGESKTDHRKRILVRSGIGAGLGAGTLMYQGRKVVSSIPKKPAWLRKVKGRAAGKDAYKAQAMKHHPDRNKGSVKAQEKMKTINKEWGEWKDKIAMVALFDEIFRINRQL